MRKSNLLKASLIGAVFLAACAEAPQSGSDVPLASTAPETVSKADPQPKQIAPAETKTEALAELPEHYQGLDPTIISRAEINELIALEQEKVDWSFKQVESYQNYENQFEAWEKQNPSTRGPQPEAPHWPREEDVNSRLDVLREKLNTAQNRKRYTGLGPSIISKSEIDELIAYEQKQEELRAAKFNAIEDWNYEDPATRGEKPEYTYEETFGSDPDMLALQLNVRQAEESNRFSARIIELGKAHNIPLLDSDLAEITALNIESSQFQTEMMLAMTKAATKSEAAGEEFSEDVFLNTIPREKFHKIVKVQERLDELTYPFDAAEKADEVRNQLKHLSEEFGITIPSRDVEEAVNLNAEKDKILKRVEMEGFSKQLDSENLLLVSFVPQAEGADKERLEEIEARLIEISEPIETARTEQLKAQK